MRCNAPTIPKLRPNIIEHQAGDGPHQRLRQWCSGMPTKSHADHARPCWCPPSRAFGRWALAPAAGRSKAKHVGRVERHGSGTAGRVAQPIDCGRGPPRRGRPHAQALPTRLRALWSKALRQHMSKSRPWRVRPWTHSTSLLTGMGLPPLPVGHRVGRCGTASGHPDSSLKFSLGFVHGDIGQQTSTALHNPRAIRWLRWSSSGQSLDHPNRFTGEAHAQR
jgi:hypothetical protein